eukprot:scaffold61315_cov30-Phaeocystis_antarctica.AAC.1
MLPNLAALGSRRQAHIGAIGEEFPSATSFKNEGQAVHLWHRLRQEYWRTLAQSPNGMAIEWLDWDMTAVPMLMREGKLPVQWVFNVMGSYEIAVLFPSDYPFSAPYYYIRTFGDVLMSVKEYVNRAPHDGEYEFSHETAWHLYPVNSQWDQTQDAWQVAGQWLPCYR